MRLNEIADNPGSRKGRMRVGRGIVCGKGTTAGRGVIVVDGRLVENLHVEQARRTLALAAAIEAMAA